MIKSQIIKLFKLVGYILVLPLVRVCRYEKVWRCLIDHIHCV